MAQIQSSSNYNFDKESFVQAGMKFILKNALDQKLMKDEIQEEDEPTTPSEAGYLANLLDPNETVSWRDVIQVKHSLVNSSDIQCPICMETLADMVCPRITKCGHIYCWPCMLQYLDYEKERNWKRCPLCFDSVYKLDLKAVEIIKSKQYKENDTITFDLMCRSRGNTLVKNKFIEAQLMAKAEKLLKDEVVLTEQQQKFVEGVIDRKDKL